MSTGTGIQWTKATWNPVAGCTRVSAGCNNCYAVAMTYRLEKMSEGRKTKDGKRWKSNKEVALHQKYAGLTVLNNHGDRHFNGQVRCVEEALEVPLKWKKPRRIFVNSMSDLFHRDVPFEFIDRVFAVMALCPQHTFQVLTKRPERMAEYFARTGVSIEALTAMLSLAPKGMTMEQTGLNIVDGQWRLSNVWLGTSCEDQAAATERIPHLLRCPAAVRFISAEPLLGPVDLSRYFGEERLRSGNGIDWHGAGLVDWVIVGGESGKGARPCNVEWIRSIVRQCQEAGVACFVKQVGKHAICGCGGDVAAWARNHGERRASCAGCGLVLPLQDTKGGDPAEWPEDLRVREWPAQKVGAA